MMCRTQRQNGLDMSIISRIFDTFWRRVDRIDMSVRICRFPGVFSTENTLSDCEQNGGRWITIYRVKPVDLSAAKVLRAKAAPDPRTRAHKEAR